MANYKIRITELDNKSRKGKYVYVKLDRKKGRYFKHYPGVSADNYIQAYEGRIKIRKKGVRDFKGRKQTEVFMNKLKRRKPIEVLLRKGIKTVIIKDLKRFRPENIRESNRKLIRRFVTDEQMVDILSEEINMQKLKKRMDFDINLKSREGKTIVNIKQFRGKTLAEIARDLNESMINGRIARGGIVRLRENKGYKINYPEGTEEIYKTPMVNVETRMTLTKGR